jgi:hypothetical protein
VRNAAGRFLPWFDTYEGDVFDRFRFVGVRRRGAATSLQRIPRGERSAAGARLPAGRAYRLRRSR